MNTRSSDMDLITDMFDTPYDDDIESNMDEHYYVGKAENILNWSPKVDRSEVLKITYEYFKSLTKDELNETAHYNFDDYITR